jgi:hypothetical protein
MSKAGATRGVRRASALQARKTLQSKALSQACGSIQAWFVAEQFCLGVFAGWTDLS